MIISIPVVSLPVVGGAAVFVALYKAFSFIFSFQFVWWTLSFVWTLGILLSARLVVHSNCVALRLPFKQIQWLAIWLLLWYNGYLPYTPAMFGLHFGIIYLCGMIP